MQKLLLDKFIVFYISAISIDKKKYISVEYWNSYKI